MCVGGGDTYNNLGTRLYVIPCNFPTHLRLLEADLLCRQLLRNMQTSMSFMPTYSIKACCKQGAGYCNPVTSHSSSHNETGCTDARKFFNRH